MIRVCFSIATHDLCTDDIILYAVAINNRLNCGNKPHSRLAFGDFDLNRSFASHNK